MSNVTPGDVDWDRLPEALFLNAVGPSRLIAVDMEDYETETSIWVGDNARFEPTGGTVSIGNAHFFWIQYGESVGYRAESELIPI